MTAASGAQRVRRRSLTDGAIARIRQVIISGELRPGDRLPPELALAAQLGLSRSSMREAVKALVLARVLDVRRGDGTYVTSLEPRLLLEGLGFAVELLQGDTVLEVMEVRRLLEPAATALAAVRAGPPVLEELLGHLERLRAAGGDAEELMRHDVAFHDCVAMATGNESLASVIRGLSTPTVHARTWRAVIEGNAAHETVAQHEAIYAALAAGDARLAHAVALVHVTTSETWMRRRLGQRPAPAPGANGARAARP